MSVTVDRNALLAAIQAVQDVVEARTTIPILGNLLVQAGDGRLTVTGTNLDLLASATCDADGAMSTTIDRTKLLSAVSSFKPGQITIRFEDMRAVLCLGRGRRTLATLPATDFPMREALTEATRFTMPAGALARLLDTCHVAMSTEETRYYLNGVFLHVQDGGLVGAATDGHRMVRTRVPVPDGAEAMPDIIVPTKAVLLLRRLVAKHEGAVALAVKGGGAGAIEATIGNVRVLAKLIDGTFPDYTRVIPAPGRHQLVGARDAFIEPATAVASVVDAEGAKVKLRAVAIEARNDGCEITSRDLNGASAVEPLDVDTEGGAIRFGVNQRYLVSIASLFAESGKLTVSLDGERAPMLITGDKDPDLLAVIMPMNA